MQFNNLVIKLASLKTDIKDICNQLETFNQSNEKTFVFIDLNPTSNLYIDFEQKKLFSSLIQSYLSQSINCLNGKIEDPKKNEYLRLLSNCLDIIRILSRDSNAIDSFNNDSLLDLLQKLAQLDHETDLFGSESLLNENVDLITFKALKSISNLIFNGKFAQKYYSNNSLSLKMVQFVQNINLNLILNSQLETNVVNINLFKMKILFLLTTFNKEYREQIRDQYQLIIYLVKIIDKITMNRIETDNHYCFLNQVDQSFIIEILKILYNLTIDIENVRMDAASILNVQTKSFINSQTVPDSANFDLLNIVCVLRDLIMCKLANQDTNQFNGLLLNSSKLNDLHSNIINLLTNVPTVYFKELICENESQYEQSDDEFKQARQLHAAKRLHRFRTLKTNTPNLDFNLVNLLNDEDLYYKGNNMEAIALIVSYMSQHTSNYLNKSGTNSIYKLMNTNVDSLDHLYPVLMLLSLMTKTNKKIRQFCHLKVLPPLKRDDLINLPQNGLAIRNRLCKMMTDPNLQLKRLCAQFLFILCKENVKKLVKYTGFGNAAGLLAETGLLLGKSGDKADYSSDSNDSDTEDYKKYEKDINPVTGRIELEESDDDDDDDKSSLIKSTMFKKVNKKDIFEGLTEEQKEYEAMKLVEAFDRLTKMGSGCIKPATIGPDGRPVEIQHVLQLQETIKENTTDKPID